MKLTTLCRQAIVPIVAVLVALCAALFKPFRAPLTVRPLFVAMSEGLAGMGTNVYQICRRNVGILEIEPWLSKASSLGDRAVDALAFVLSLFRSPAMRLGAMAALALLISHIDAHAGTMTAAITIVVGTDPKELREQANKLGTDMTDLLSKAAGEKRELTPEEETKFDAMNEDRDKLLKAEERALTVAGFGDSAGRRAAPRQPGAQPAPGGGGKGDERRSVNLVDGLRSWLLRSKGMDLQPEQIETAKRLGIDLNARQIKLSLPDRPLRSLRGNEVDEWEKRALSTLNAGSPVDGFYTVQNELMRPLEEALLAFGGMRRFSTILRTGTGAQLPIPTDNDTSNEGEIIGENAAVNEQDVAFNQLVLEAYKYSSKMIKVSVELLQDSSINIGEYLGRKLGQRIGRITNRHFTVGTGNSQPYGIVPAATSAGVALAGKTPTYAEMVSIQHAVDPSYREMPSSGWMFHDTLLAEVKKIVDASTGRPIWVPDMAGGAPDQILGDPFVVNQHMAVAAATGAGKSIIYGDLSKYQIRDVRDITLVRLDERFAEYHQVAFLAFSRHDGDLLDAGTHPVVYATNHA